MAWEDSQALAAFRRLLGDTSTDKFVFRQDVDPTPDGVTKHFQLGETNVIEATVKIYKNGALMNSGYTLDAPNGVIEFTNPPAIEERIQASFNFQWFNDDQLRGFLDSGANSVAIESFVDDALPIGLRPGVLHLASYFAYMMKSAETADQVSTDAEGFKYDQRSFANWKKMAENAKDSAQKAIEFYNLNILNSGGIGIAIRTYRLPDYVPHS